MTEKQFKVYKYYLGYIVSNKSTPSYTKASKDLLVSPSVIHNHIKSLVKKGYLAKDDRGGILPGEITDTGIDLPNHGEPITAFGMRYGLFREYKIIHNLNIRELEKEVNEYIKIGGEVVGGLSISVSQGIETYHQALRIK